MTSWKRSSVSVPAGVAVAIIIGAGSIQAAIPAESNAVAADAEAAAHENWRATMAHNGEAREGCFQASYPNLVWEQVACKEAHPRVHPVHKKRAPGAAEVTGNGNDFVAQAAGLITETIGSFPTVSDVKSEKSVGVAAFGGGGILGPNEYTLQINSNYTGTTSVCAGHSGCTVWQQFIYSPDYNTDGEAAVFMQYWLLDWGSSRCPGGWGSDGEGDCYKNSAYVAAPDVAISSLASLTLSGTVVAGGKDTVVFNNGSKAYSITGNDSVVDISSVWNQSEFNVVGNAGGSRANFNKGASITVKVALKDGSTTAPACVANDGSTGETNNLNLGTCSTAGGSSPSIKFTESD